MRGHFLVIGIVALASACSSELANMSDTELQDKAFQCKSGGEQAPGMAITCDNYQRECLRRREEGRFVC